MQLLTRPLLKKNYCQPPQLSERQRLSPFMLVGLIVTILITLIAGIFLLTRSHTGTQIAVLNLMLPLRLLACSHFL